MDLENSISISIIFPLLFGFPELVPLLPDFVRVIVEVVGAVQEAGFLVVSERTSIQLIDHHQQRYDRLVYHENVDGSKPEEVVVDVGNQTKNRKNHDHYLHNESVAPNGKVLFFEELSLEHYLPRTQDRTRRSRGP